MANGGISKRKSELYQRVQDLKNAELEQIQYRAGFSLLMGKEDLI